MKIVILAGGIGKRIAPLGIHKPKSMFQIMGKPILLHVIDQVVAANIPVEEAIIVIGPGESQIREYIEAKTDLPFPVRFTIQEQPLGQANAMSTARPYLQDNFLVLNANDIYDPALLTDLTAKAAAESWDVGLVGQTREDYWNYGVMRLDGQHKLVGVVEKPPRDSQIESGVIVLGIYYFSPRIWSALDETPIQEKDDQLERAYQKLITHHNSGYIQYDANEHYSGKFASYKYPWHLFDISAILLSRIQGMHIGPNCSISPMAVIDGNVILESGVRVFEFSVIHGPAYIGKDSIIGNNTLLRGGVSLGAGCVVGFGTEIKHAILGEGVWMHKNFIGDSIISDRCSFGAGTITANLRFKEDAVSFKVNADQPRVSTGTEYFGMIMAEDCRTGCNSVLSPGVKIGPNSIVEAGVVLKQDLPPNSIASKVKNSVEIRPSEIDIHALSEKRNEHKKKQGK